MSKLFISHSSQDDAFVRDLRAALAMHGVDAWIDSRELVPGGLTGFNGQPKAYSIPLTHP